LGDVVFVEAPDVGDDLDAGGEAGVVESVKAASDIYSPVSGEVVAINAVLEDTPETINEDPYGEGWMFRVKPADVSELDELLSAEAYEASCEE
jgi:glycine cleavage system H protein